MVAQDWRVPPKFVLELQEQGVLHTPSPLCLLEFVDERDMLMFSNVQDQH
jgi:hypothetical protein